MPASAVVWADCCPESRTVNCALLTQGYTRFIELGPGAALSGFMKRIDKTATMLNVADAASLEATAKALAQ